MLENSLLLTSRISLGSYPGGKSNKQKHAPLYKATPSKISTLIEPFSGLASFTIINSPKVHNAIINDIDPEVVAFLKCIKDPQLLSSLKDRVNEIYPVSKGDYYAFKTSKSPDPLDLATKRVIIQNCSFSGAGGGYSSSKAKRNWNVNRPKQWDKVNHIFSKLNVKINNTHYLNFLERIIDMNYYGELGESPFVYLDPPYYKVAERGRLYNYNSVDLSILLETLHSLDNANIHWIMSNRDHPVMRQGFSEYYMYSYNTYNDMSNTRNGNPELLISNREFTALPD